MLNLTCFHCWHMYIEFRIRKVCLFKNFQWFSRCCWWNLGTRLCKGDLPLVSLRIYTYFNAKYSSYPNSSKSQKYNSLMLCCSSNIYHLCFCWVNKRKFNDSTEKTWKRVLFTYFIFTFFFAKTIFSVCNMRNYWNEQSKFRHSMVYLYRIK